MSIYDHKTVPHDKAFDHFLQ